MVEVNSSVIAITGASSGIGAAAARALAAEGAKVVIGARRAERLKALAAELNGSAIVVEMDVRKSEDSQQLVKAALDAHGRLDTIVVSAGIGVYGGIMDMSDQQIEEMIETNVSGTVWPIRAAVPLLLEGGGGDIVIVASMAGLHGAGNEAVYAATKFAQIGLAEALGRELREKGIRVTVICPGGVATEFAMGTGRSPDMPGLEEMLRPEDVAAAIVSVLKQPRTMRSLVWSMKHPRARLSVEQPDFDLGGRVALVTGAGRILAAGCPPQAVSSVPREAVTVPCAATVGGR